jgi:hypothetical protein
MGAMVDVMHKGGPFMWLLLLLAFSAPLPLLVGLILMALRRWAPALLFWTVPLLLVLAGIVGRLQGHIMVGEAVAFASPETQSQLLHAGIGVAAYTEWAAWGVAALLLSLSASLAGLCLLLGAGERGRWTPLAVLPVLASMGLAPVVLVVMPRAGLPSGPGYWGALLLVLMGGVGLLFAHLRSSEDPDDRARIASGRLLVLSLAAGGLVFAAMGGWLMGFSELHEAMAHAAASARPGLAEMGRQLSLAWLWPCLVGGAFLMAGGLLATALGLVHATRPRHLLSAAVVALGLLTAAGAAGGVAWQAHDLDQRTLERRLAWALELVPDPPRPVAAGSEEPSDLEARGFVDIVAWQGSAWRPLGVRPGDRPDWELPLEWNDGALLVIAPAELSAARLVETSWGETDGRPRPQRLMVLTEQGPAASPRPAPRALSVGMLELNWVPVSAWPAADGDSYGGMDLEELLASSGPESGWLDYGELVFVDGRGDGLAVHSLEGAEEGLSVVAPTIRRFAERDPELSEIVVVPGASWSLQDLVSHCLAAHEALPRAELASWERPEVGCAVTSELPEALGRAQARPSSAAQGALGGLGGMGLAPGVQLHDDATVLGALDKGIIQQVIRRHMNQLRYCYQRELTTSPSLSGRIEVKFVVARDGTVSSASVASSTMGNQAVESCIAGRFQRMVFPEPQGGGIVVVRYPLVFQATP